MINPISNRAKLTIPGVYSKMAMEILQCFITRVCFKARWTKLVSGIMDVGINANGEVTLFANETFGWKTRLNKDDAPANAFANALKKVAYAFKDEFIKRNFWNAADLMKTEDGMASTMDVQQWDIDKVHDCTILNQAGITLPVVKDALTTYCELFRFKNCLWDLDHYFSYNKDGITEDMFKVTQTFTLKQLRCLYEIMMGRDRRKLAEKYGKVYTDMIGEAPDPFSMVALQSYNDTIMEEDTAYMKRLNDEDAAYEQKKRKLLDDLKEEYKKNVKAIQEAHNAKVLSIKKQFSIEEFINA